MGTHPTEKKEELFHGSAAATAMPLSAAAGTADALRPLADHQRLRAARPRHRGKLWPGAWHHRALAQCRRPDRRLVPDHLRWQHLDLHGAMRAGTPRRL